jgi:hypothetical protein
VRHYVDGEEVPETGMGSWCDDSRLPDLAAFCADHRDVLGCDEHCADHGCATGDGDADADHETDAEPDGDADADLEPECTIDAPCPTPERPRCEGGECTGCTGREDCERFPDAPVCGGSACVLCTAEDASACTDLARPNCEPGTHTCVECAENSHCSSADASRCDLDRHECASCDEQSQCSHIEGRPFCHDHSCVECASSSDCRLEDELVCNLASHECVQACLGCTNSDDQCAELGPGFACVVDDTFGGRHCMQEATTCDRPWRSEQRARDGGGSADLVDVCIPPPTTTCWGIVEVGTECDPERPEDAFECGENGTGDDASCPSTVAACTYDCEGPGGTGEALWCPAGFECREHRTGQWVCALP